MYLASLIHKGLCIGVTTICSLIFIIAYYHMIKEVVAEMKKDYVKTKKLSSIASGIVFFALLIVIAVVFALRLLRII